MHPVDSTVSLADSRPLNADKSRWRALPLFSKSSSQLINRRLQSSIFDVASIRLESNTDDEIYLEISTEALGTALRSAKVSLRYLDSRLVLMSYDSGFSDVYAQAVEEG